MDWKALADAGRLEDAVEAYRKQYPDVPAWMARSAVQDYSTYRKRVTQ